MLEREILPESGVFPPFRRLRARGFVPLDPFPGPEILRSDARCSALAASFSLGRGERGSFLYQSLE